MIKKFFKSKSSEDYFFVALVAALCVLAFILRADKTAMVAVIGLAIAAATMAMIRITARQQATLKVMDEFSSVRMLPGRELIRSFHNAVIAGKAQHGVDTIIKCEKDVENIRIFAEYMENLAVGLKHQIYNLQMVEDWLGKDVRTYYDAAEPMIKIYRETAPSDGPKSQYKNFQALADHFSNPDNCRAIIPSMSDKNQLLVAIIGTGLVIGGWLSMSIGEVRQDIRDIRADMREIRADIRQVSATAKADSDKNSAQLAAHLTSHAAE